MTSNSITSWWSLFWGSNYSYRSETALCLCTWVVSCSAGHLVNIIIIMKLNFIVLALLPL